MADETDWHGLLVCPECGAVCADAAKHSEYHNEWTLLLKGLRDLLVKFRVIKKVDNG